MTAQLLEQLAAARIPDPRRPVAACGHDEAPVGAVGGAVDHARPGQLVAPVTGPGRPRWDRRAIAAGGDDGFAVGAEGGAVQPEAVAAKDEAWAYTAPGAPDAQGSVAPGGGDETAVGTKAAPYSGPFVAEGVDRPGAANVPKSDGPVVAAGDDRTTVGAESRALNASADPGQALEELSGTAVPDACRSARARSDDQSTVRTHVRVQGTPEGMKRAQAAPGSSVPDARGPVNAGGDHESTVRAKAAL